eukprot:10802005-Lingulodinium_polyedra.AAC.1
MARRVRWSPLCPEGRPRRLYFGICVGKRRNVRRCATVHVLRGVPGQPRRRPEVRRRHLPGHWICSCDPGGLACCRR